MRDSQIDPKKRFFAGVIKRRTPHDETVRELLRPTRREQLAMLRQAVENTAALPVPR